MAKRDHKKIERERQRDSDDELASIINNENVDHVYDEHNKRDDLFPIPTWLDGRDWMDFHNAQWVLRKEFPDNNTIHELLREYIESTSIDFNPPVKLNDYLPQLGTLKKIKELIEKQNETEPFIKKLILWCEGDGEFYVREPGKRQKARTPSGLACRDKETEEWKALIKILTSPGGKFAYNTESKRQVLNRLESKLKKFFEQEFNLTFSDQFKLFKRTGGEGSVWEPLFMTEKPVAIEIQEDYKDFNKTEILAEIRRHLNENADQSTVKRAADHALSIGVTRNELADLTDFERRADSRVEKDYPKEQDE